MLPTRGVARRPPTRCRNNGHVATATTEVTPRTSASRPSLVSVGTIVWLSSELMFFAALFAMYFTVRSVTKGSSQPWPGAHLNIALGSINTTVLLLSSVTCQMGVFAVEHHHVRAGGVEQPEQRRLGGYFNYFGVRDIHRGTTPDGEPDLSSHIRVMAVHNDLHDTAWYRAPEKPVPPTRGVA